MSNSHTMYARICAIFFVLMFSSAAFGGATKVDVCHIPLGDPDNFHTIRISEKAVPSHLNHGDLEGACEVDPEISCPCFTQEELEALSFQGCLTLGTDILVFFQGATACAGDSGNCTTVTPGCSLSGTVVTDIEVSPITADENTACLSIIDLTCASNTP